MSFDIPKAHRPKVKGNGTGHGKRTREYLLGSERRVEERLREAGVLSIADAVARRWRITRGKLIGRDRSMRSAIARRELYGILYWSLAPISYPELGHLLDRDHTTLMAMIRTREQELAAECSHLGKTVKAKDVSETAQDPKALTTS